ncbi:MAG TPA: hypothetical protein VFS31_19445 [Chitinophagaceae bacterium]|nr:hypothetical protein [Chitinophagaceae bacterium]
MTQLLNCTLYYSVIGERFKIYDRNTDPNVVRTSAMIHLHAQTHELVPTGNDVPEDSLFEHLTRMVIPNEVRGGSFYASDTQCIIVNGRNQILKLGGKYRFDIKMYRNLNDPTLFSVFFKEKEFHAAPEWISF